MSTIRVEFFDREPFITTDLIDDNGNSSFTIPLEIEGVIISVYNDNTNKKLFGLFGFDRPYTKTIRETLTITTTEKHWVDDKREQVKTEEALDKAAKMRFIINEN